MADLPAGLTPEPPAPNLPAGLSASPPLPPGLSTQAPESPQFPAGLSLDKPLPEAGPNDFTDPLSGLTPEQGATGLENLGSRYLRGLQQRNEEFRAAREETEQLQHQAETEGQPYALVTGSKEQSLIGQEGFGLATGIIGQAGPDMLALWQGLKSLLGGVTRTAPAAAEQAAERVAAQAHPIPGSPEAPQAAQQAMARYWEAQEGVPEQQTAKAGAQNLVRQSQALAPPLTANEIESANAYFKARPDIDPQQYVWPHRGAGGGEPPAIRPPDEVIPPGQEPLTTSVLTPEQQKAGMLAAREILQARGINPTDLAPDKVMDQVSGLIRSAQDNPGQLHGIFGTLMEHDLTPADFSEMMSGAATHAGRSLNVLSQFWQDVRSRALQGDQAAQRMIQSRGPDEPGSSWWQLAQNTTKLAMVANLSVAMRNMLDAGILGVAKDLSRGLTVGLQKIFGVTSAPDIQTFRPGQDLNRTFNPFGGIQAAQRQTVQLAQAFPEVRALGANFASDVSTSLSQKVGKTLGPIIGAPINAVTWLHTLQERIVRNAAFTGALDRRLRGIGGSLDQVLQSGQVPKGFTAILRDSIGDGLDAAWAKNIPQDTVLGRSVGKMAQGLSNIPGVGLFAMPFARMLFNQIQHVADWHFGAVKALVSPSEWAKVAAGDFTPLTRAAVGGGLLTLGYAIRSGQLADYGIRPGPRWDQIAVGAPNEQGQSKTISLAPLGMLSPALFIGDLVHRIKSSTFQVGDLQRSMEGLGARVPSFQPITIAEHAIEQLGGARTLEDFRRMAEGVGSDVATAINPMRQVWDFLSQWDPSLRLHRQTAGFGATGEVEALGNPKALPPKLSPTQAAPVSTPTFDVGGTQIAGGVLHQLTGLPNEQAPTPIQAELDRLGFQPTFYSPHTGNPRADQLVDQIAGPAVEHIGGQLVGSPIYQQATESQKAVYMQLLFHGDPTGRLTGQRFPGILSAAEQAAITLAPTMLGELKAEKMFPLVVQRAMEEASQGAFSAIFNMARQKGAQELGAQGR